MYWAEAANTPRSFCTALLRITASHAGSGHIRLGNHWYNGDDAQEWWLDDHALLQPTGEPWKRRTRVYTAE